MREKLRGGSIRRERTAAHHRRLHPLRGHLSAAATSGSPGSCWCPTGKGPFPAVVLNHGYIEPSIYVTGQGLAREQDYLARAGFVVLHTDYRGHAGVRPGDAARAARPGSATPATRSTPCSR